MITMYKANNTYMISPTRPNTMMYILNAQLQQLTTSREGYQKSRRVTTSKLGTNNPHLLPFNT